MISHIDNIKTFINDYVENPNAKIRGILQDLLNDGIPIVSNICAIAILSSIVTEPFWRLINDNSTTHFDLHQYVCPYNKLYIVGAKILQFYYAKMFHHCLQSIHINHTTFCTRETNLVSQH